MQVVSCARRAHETTCILSLPLCRCDVQNILQNSPKSHPAC
uniref:Uncharacterized protein n=1 Tax=Anguilla anguilla TaxID=7936 RepID=A0A0E9USR0_ANGAN